MRVTDQPTGQTGVLDPGAKESRQLACRYEDAEQFLRVLDPNASGWNFRTLDDKGSGAGKNYSGTLAELWDDIQIANGNGRGVFVVINEGGHKKADIAGIRAVWADLDGVPLPAVAPALRPHLVVESSPGKFHIYWRVTNLGLEQFGPLQKAIAAVFGGDPSVHDLPRVMRLPGTLHHKGEPFQSRIIHDSAALPYSAEDVVRAFPLARPAGLPTVLATSGSGVVVETERHADLLRIAAHAAKSVVRHGVAAENAWTLLMAEAARGRWTRDVAVNEIRRAFDGALEKYRSGEWSQREDAGASLTTAPHGTHEPLIEVELGDLMTAEITPPQFVFNPIIPRGEVTLLSGHGGSGKSTLALTLCAHAACGRAWANFACHDPIFAVFVSLEDPGELVRFRLRGVVDAYSLDLQLVLQNLRILDGSHTDASLVTEVAELGTRKLRATPRMTELRAAVTGAGLIVIDNASDTFDGDENNRGHVRYFMRLLKQTAREGDAGLVLLAHIDKHAAMHGGRGNSYSGSTAWNNSARSRLAVLSDQGPIQLRHEKANLSKLAEITYLEWTENLGGGVLVPSTLDRGCEQEATAKQVKNDANEVLKVMGVAREAEVPIPSAASGSATWGHAFESLPELALMYRNRAGRKRIAAALIQLRRDGLVAHVQVKTSSRNTKEVLELTQAGQDALVSMRAFVPHTPGETDARAEERAPVVSYKPPDATHATHATDAGRGFAFRQHSPGILYGELKGIPHD